MSRQGMMVIDGQKAIRQVMSRGPDDPWVTCTGGGHFATHIHTTDGARRCRADCCRETLRAIEREPTS